MRIVAVLRGFPGLGRVISGMEVLAFLKEKYKAEVKLFTYLQGGEYVKSLGYSVISPEDQRDLCSIGIVPVSCYGESIIDCISNWPADLVLIDGEPLLVHAIHLVRTRCQVVALLNPFDVCNPYNTLISQRFFNDCYSKADTAIVHGLWPVETRDEYQRFYSIPTILRSSILQLEPLYSEKKITCVLGGGTERSNQSFLATTIKIGQLCIQAAKDLCDYRFDLYCGSKSVATQLSIHTNPENVAIHDTLGSVQELYSTSQLVISRAGRNTLSELLYLGLPAVGLSASDPHRGFEQKTNLEAIKDLSGNTITDLDPACSGKEMSNAIQKVLGRQGKKGSWVPGNEYLNQIL